MKSDETERKHHAFSPSSLIRRELCPGSYRIETMTKENPPESEAAKEGTRLHLIISDVLNGNRKLEDVEQKDAEIIGKMKNEFDKICARVFEKCGEQSLLLIENKLRFVLYGQELVYGFADVVIVDRKNRAATIIDWKTGRGTVEDAANNPQGAAYALCVMQMFDCEKVNVVFYNPNTNWESEAIFDDNAAILNYIIEVIDKAMEDGAKCVTGETQCKYCKGALCGTCPAYMAEHSAIAERAKADPVESVRQLDDTQLNELKTRCDMVSKLADAVDSELKSRCEKNGQCGNWKLKERSGARSFVDVPKLLIAVKDVIPDSVMAGIITVSYTAAETAYAKALHDRDGIPLATGKKQFAEVTADNVKRGNSTFTLVSADK